MEERVERMRLSLELLCKDLFILETDNSCSTPAQVRGIHAKALAQASAMPLACVEAGRSAIGQPVS